MKKILFGCGLVFASVALLIFVFLIQPRRPMAKILLYHSLSVDGKSYGEPVLDRELFRTQLDYLKRHGYQTVFLTDIVQRRQEGKPIPAQWVVITFDDGWKDFYTVTYPLLKAYGAKADLFVSSGLICQDESYMTWDQVRDVRRSGLVEIGSHSLFHFALTCLAEGDVKERTKLAKAMLEKELGEPVKIFAYPYGAQNDDVRQVIKSNGFEAAVGTAYPLGKFKTGDIFNMRRIYVSDISRWPLMFRFMLTGYYVPTRAFLLRVLHINAPRDAEECDNWREMLLTYQSQQKEIKKIKKEVSVPGGV